MSEEIKNIKENIMDQINHGKIKMKPKTYFILGSIITFLGLVFSTIFSMFLIGLMRFSFRSRGPMSDYKFDQMISNFPWWTLILAILSLIIGLYLIKKYDFSYKIKPWVIILIFITIVIFSGILIDIIGVNDTLRYHGPMQGMMNNYIEGGGMRGMGNPMRFK